MGVEFKGLRSRLVEPPVSGRITDDGGSLVSAAAANNDAITSPATPSGTALANSFMSHWTTNHAGCSERTPGADMAGSPETGRILFANATGWPMEPV